jgi:hypothetical protein
MTRTGRTTRSAHSAGAGEGGFALAGATILVFAMILIGAAFFSVAGYETRQSQLDLSSQKAFWLAEAGKERGLRWMTAQSRPPDTDVGIYTDQAGPDGGTYTVACRVDTSAAFAASKTFVLECVGNWNGRERRIRQRIRMLSFGQYGYFTNEETTPGGSTIWFVTGDAIQGLVHTNGVFHISGNPRFLGHVSSASDHMIASPSYNVYSLDEWPVGSNNPFFGDGLDLGVPEIPLPSQTLDLKNEAQFGGLFLANASTIELGVDVNGVVKKGWLRYQNTPPPNNSPWTAVAVSTLSTHIIYSNNDLQVSGVLSGEITIGSKKNIWIMDDVRYFDSSAQGVPSANCRDLLGLVAEDNIIYKDNTANQTNLIVDAVMMALDTSIQAENHTSGDPRGTLTVWGGLIQECRGPVGQVNSSGQIIHGYKKDYHYDSRVTGRTPPGFPLTGVYQKVAWTETWDDSYPF